MEREPNVDWDMVIESLAEKIARSSFAHDAAVFHQRKAEEASRESATNAAARDALASVIQVSGLLPDGDLQAWMDADRMGLRTAAEKFLGELREGRS